MAEQVGGIYYECALETQQVINGRKVIEREVDLSARAFNKITQAIGLYAAAMATVKSAQAADDIRLLGARVQVAAGNIERGAAAMAELERISARTQTRITENAAVFARLNSSILQMGGTQQDTLRLTELLGMGIKVSGASAAEASAAMLQFGQALASGKLQGDELRSLLENAPYLMQRLADGIGVPVGQLRKLGEEGKLTADVITQALGKAAEQIESDFKKLPQTFDAALGGAEDAARRANEAFDTLTGTSAALTGVAKGTGTALDLLAQAFRDATTESDKLGRSDAVQSWSKAATTALSYVADGADIAWQALSVLGRNVAFVFTAIGREIGGIGAQAYAVLKGDFAAAKAIHEQMVADAQRARAELDAADAKTLARASTIGQQMRDRMAQARVEDRGFTPSTGIGKLKPAPGGDTGGAKFDSAGYLAKLEAETKDGVERVNIIEQEALRKNQELLKAGKISREQAAQAAALIEANAAQDRLQIQLRGAEEYRQAIEEAGRKETEERAKIAAEQARGRQLAETTIAGSDPVQAVILEAQRKSDALAEAAARDQANAQLYAEARVALEQQTADRLREIAQQRATAQAAADSAMLQGYSGLFGSLADVSKQFAGEQSGIYRAMFAVSKAFAIADSIVKIQQGIANSLSLPFPANLAAAASTAAQAVGIVSTIRGTNFGGGRQYGGPVVDGTLYRVNETGRPEMFTAANGAQYMLPTASGSVTPASELGAAGGVSVKVEIVNTGTPQQVVSQSYDSDARIVRLVTADIASQIDANSGPVWTSLKRSTNVASKL